MSADPRHTNISRLIDIRESRFAGRRIHYTQCAWEQSPGTKMLCVATMLCVLTLLGAWSLALPSNSVYAAGEVNSGVLPAQDDRTQIDQLVQQLGDDRYDQRLEAEQKLLEIGANSLGSLIPAISSNEPEVAWRAAELVERIAIEGNEQTLAEISSQLDLVGREFNRPDLIRRGAHLRQLWKRHRTQAAIAQLQAKNAQVVASQYYDTGMGGGFGGGGIIIEDRVILRGADGALRVVPQNQGGQIGGNQNGATADANEGHGNLAAGPDVWNQEIANQIGMPPEWLSSLQADSANGNLAELQPRDMSGLIDRRREEMRRRLVHEVWRIKENHLPYDPVEAANRAEKSQELRANIFAQGSVDELENEAQLEQIEERIFQVLAQEEVRIGRVDLAIGGARGIIAEDIAIFGIAGEVEANDSSPHIHYVTLDANWNGTPEDLQLLQQIENLAWIEVNSCSVSPDLLLEIALLDSIETISITNASFDTDWMKALRKVKPELQMTIAGPAYLGVNADIENDASIDGCAVTNVLQSSAADHAGLKIGDVITRVNDQKIADFTDLTLAIANKRVEEVVEVEVRRNETQIVARAKLGDRENPIR